MGTDRSIRCPRMMGGGERLWLLYPSFVRCGGARMFGARFLLGLKGFCRVQGRMSSYLVVLVYR